MNLMGKKAILSALLTALFLKLFIFDFIVAQGQSMEPAIKNGKVLIINKVKYGIKLPLKQVYLIRWAQPKEGEVVVFYTPEGELAVKRCIELTDKNFYAVGDNNIASYDSRSYGSVSVDNIIGKVLGY
ncbi:MAG: signal peptidase I [Treponema sp.]|nr:signal peptidase I [Treponema sp.]